MEPHTSSIRVPHVAILIPAFLLILMTQVLVQLGYAPTLLPTAAAAVISVLLLMRGQLLELLMLGVATATMVSVEPAPCDTFFVAFVGGALWQARDTLSVHGRALFTWTGGALAIHTALTALLLLVYFNVSGVRFAAITFYLIALFVALIVWRDMENHLNHLAAAYALSFVPVVTALPWGSELQIGDRFMGWFKDPNVLAAYAVPGILLCLSILAIRGVRAKGWQSLSLAVALAILIGITASRGAFVNLGIGIGALFILAIWYRLRAWVVATTGFVVVALATGLWLGPLLSVVDDLATREGGIVVEESPSQGAQSGSDLPAAQGQTVSSSPEPVALSSRPFWSDPGRINNYVAGMRVAVGHPLGVGPANYERHAIQYAPANEPFANAAHSLYFRALVETGALGLVSLLVFLGGVLRLSWPSRAESGDQFIPLFLVSTLAGALVHSILIDTIHWRHFWLIIGFAVALRAPSVARTKTISSGRELAS